MCGTRRKRKSQPSDRSLEFSTLDTIPPQPLESARVSFRDHIADAATEVARLEWLVSADKPVYALEISDQNNLLEGLTVQLETDADTLWTRATQDNDTVEAFMLGDSIAENTLTLRAYDAEGNLVELDASITALLYAAQCRRVVHARGLRPRLFG